MANLTEKGYQVGLKDHYHTFNTINGINLKLTKSANSAIDTYTKSRGKQPHNGDKFNVKTKASVSFNAKDISIPEFQTNSNGVNSAPELARCEIRVMVYIGRRTKPYSEA